MVVFLFLTSNVCWVLGDLYEARDFCVVRENYEYQNYRKEKFRERRITRGSVFWVPAIDEVFLFGTFVKSGFLCCWGKRDALAFTSFVRRGVRIC